MSSQDYEMLCRFCDEPENVVLHHSVSTPSYISMYGDDHVEECNYEASYEGEETGWVPTMDCHEFEETCTCGETSRCDYCVEKAVDMADMMRDQIKEGQYE